MHKEMARLVKAFLNGDHNKADLNIGFEILVAFASRIFEQLTEHRKKTLDTRHMTPTDWHPNGFRVAGIRRQQFEKEGLRLVDEFLASQPDQEALLEVGNGLTDLANHIQSKIVGHD